MSSASQEYQPYLQPGGFKNWFFSVDHKRIGLMYLYSILIFFLIAGLCAMAVRAELLFPNANHQIFDHHGYNIMFTLHGAIMVFLFIVPGIPATLGNFLLPIMIGAKDVAFPRLNILSYWIYVVGAIAVVWSLIGPLPSIENGLIKFPANWLDTGWTFYTPYSIQSSAGVIPVTLGAFILGFASILTGLNFVVTIHKFRAPGMTWHRLPLFVWALYSASLIQILATPIIGITLALLIMERVLEIGFFSAALGGDPILFENFFWFYSHPVVYIMILPAMGVVAEILPVFAKKPIFGYRAIAYSSLAIALVSFFVWGHHLFVSGMSYWSRWIFSLLTFAVAIPTAIKVFNWISTLYKGSIRMDTPMLYACGFIFLFTIAGLTGLPLATLSTDVFLHDTYFVVAHFHYTMQGGTVVALVGGLYFWWPKIYGRMYNETVGKIGFWMLFLGFNAAFMPQFILGYMGMPRRYADYLGEFAELHFASSLGAFINGLAYVVIFGNLLWAAKRGKVASKNPFNSLSLEWTVPSPPPLTNFDEVPTVTTWTYGYGEEQNA
ncbi:MAG: cbb3-type cytochrome c oxidase subunit I [Acidobacteriota bacterium]|nr:cbb3-type cytochrome c oxidase subunit I [Acidobacteriota bacterium]